MRIAIDHPQTQQAHANEHGAPVFLSCCPSPTSFSHCFYFVGNGRISVVTVSLLRSLCLLNAPKCALQHQVSTSSTFGLSKNLFPAKFCVDTQCTPLLHHSSSCWRSRARNSSARRGSTLFARVDGIRDHPYITTHFPQHPASFSLSWKSIPSFGLAPLPPPPGYPDMSLLYFRISRTMS